MISNELMEVCLKISYFYLEKNFDDYEAAEKEILSLLITNVEISEDGKSVYISTEKPGILIGRYGDNIKKLSEFFAPMEVKIKEDEKRLHSFLIPQREMY